MGPVKKTRRALSVHQKMEILKEIDDGTKMSHVGRKYGLSSSTVCCIVKNREKLEATYDFYKYFPNRKRCRNADFSDIEAAVLQWYLEKRSQNISLSGSTVRAKAQELAKMMGHNEFLPSSGWLWRFKGRHGLKGMEKGNKMRRPLLSQRWCDDTMPQLVDGYDPKDIFIASETALLYHLTPDRLCEFQAGCHSNNSKDRLTVLLCANMDGSEKLMPLVIGRYTHPRSLRKKPVLPVTYKSNLHALMNATLFEKWVREVDSVFQEQGRRALLFVTNCSAHPPVSGLTSIQLHLFPPNINGTVHPMQLGFKTFKVMYRRHLIRELVDSYEAGEEVTPITVKHAAELISWAWLAVPPSVLVDGYVMARFRKAEPSSSTSPEGAPINAANREPSSSADSSSRLNPTRKQAEVRYAALPNDNLELWNKLARHTKRNDFLDLVTFDQYVAVDASLPCIYVHTEEEIVNQVMSEHVGEEHNGAITKKTNAPKEKEATRVKEEAESSEEGAWIDIEEEVAANEEDGEMTTAQTSHSFPVDQSTCNIGEALASLQHLQEFVYSKGAGMEVIKSLAKLQEFILSQHGNSK